MTDWISVKNKLPEINEKVIVCITPSSPLTYSATAQGSNYRTAILGQYIGSIGIENEMRSDKWIIYDIDHTFEFCSNYSIKNDYLYANLGEMGKGISIITHWRKVDEFPLE